MQFRVPILVVQVKGGYTARPLFHPRPSRSDDNLQRLTTKLTRDLIQLIEVQARSHRQDDVALWTFAPAVTTHRHDVEIDLRRRLVKLRLLFVQWEQWDRKLAFCPAIPDVWFEVARGERLEHRAAEVLQDHWRKLEREADGDADVSPEEAQFTGKAWVHTLEFSARTNVPIPKQPGLPFFFLGGNAAPDGAEELRRVGRCLDWLYPDELDRVKLREAEVAELGRLLDAPDSRPILLVGPRQCGKTAIIHECVYRTLADRTPEDKRKRGQTWLISPQRLISGMSYVGQWEGRLLAILKHARKRKHVLFFDDLLGLFHAGVTSQSTLNAATVLKPYLEDREVRVLAEISPEQFRVLQEQDRGFADLFHVLPVREPVDADLSRILVSVQRRLEGKHPVRYGLDVMPTVIDLQRRYERAAAFPGKAVAVLTRLAVRAAHTKPSDAEDNTLEPVLKSTLIERGEVLNDIAQRSGLSLAFLDPARKLDRDDVRRQLATQVIGQDAAVDAVADVVSIAKARLNDPNRPIASFLLVGPTGVGKTELAKATARTLFGDADHLVRFDLNEYNAAGSAAKLVGTFQQPEGLLTAALRRQPFCVLLFDEVEKAHPDVHDVMLQVLGEGRLTDALGRTADFTNAIILLTSNLGVREAGGRIGFLPAVDSPAAYARSAERFFRPEFFNRLDRVIPFRTLTRTELAKIAERLLAEVLAREGFGQRQCVLSVAPEALNRVIDAGYDPELGARAMKRAVERELTKPAAAQLAGLAPDQLTVVSIRSAGGELHVGVQVPGWAERQHPMADRSTEERIALGLDSLDVLQQRIAALRPQQGAVSGKVSPEQERYYAIKEVAAETAERWEAIEQQLENKRRSRYEATQADTIGKKARYRVSKDVANKEYKGWDQPFSSLFSALSIEEAIDDLVRDSEPLPGDAELFDLENRLALLQLMASAPVDPRPVFLWVRGLANSSHDAVDFVTTRFRESWGSDLGVEIAERTQRDFRIENTDRVIELFGIHARTLAEHEAGTHLYLPKHGGLLPARVAVSDSHECPFDDSYGPILRVYPEGKPILDIRTGLVCLPPYPAGVFRTLTLASLPRA
jgi:ATP-dependent Clp protease ATP-binding subunit ClpA